MELKGKKIEAFKGTLFLSPEFMTRALWVFSCKAVSEVVSSCRLWNRIKKRVCVEPQKSRPSDSGPRCSSQEHVHCHHQYRVSLWWEDAVGTHHGGVLKASFLVNCVGRRRLSLPIQRANIDRLSFRARPCSKHFMSVKVRGSSVSWFRTQTLGWLDY